MEIVKYEIKPNDTLASVAKKNNISVDEMLKFHNENSDLTHQIYSDTIPFHITVLLLDMEFKKRQEEELREKDVIKFDQEIRYRSEQTVVTKINSVIQNHAETKREFLISKNISGEGIIVKVQMMDNIIKFEPSYLQDSMNLICEIDKIKCNATLLVNLSTGKIKAIINKAEILDKWIGFRKQMQNNTAFIRDTESQNIINQFLELMDKQIENESSLIEDLESKPFFHLIFDKYLVKNETFTQPYNLNFNSQLFEGMSLELNMTQQILGENEKLVNVRRVSTLNRKILSNDILEKKYNEKYRPIIDYKFTSYDFSYRTNTSYNTNEDLIETAEMTMIEQVKNNIQTLVSYKLNKIEL